MTGEGSRGQVSWAVGFTNAPPRDSWRLPGLQLLQHVLARHTRAHAQTLPATPAGHMESSRAPSRGRTVGSGGGPSPLTGPSEHLCQLWSPRTQSVASGVFLEPLVLPPAPLTFAYPTSSRSPLRLWKHLAEHSQEEALGLIVTQVAAGSVLRDRRGPGGWRGCSRDAGTPTPRPSPPLSPPALPVRGEMVSAPELAQGGVWRWRCLYQKSKLRLGLLT